MSGLAVIWMAWMSAMPESAVVGVIVPRPVEAVDEVMWQTLTRLEAVAEIHLHGESDSPDTPFGFTVFDKALSEFQSQGIPVSATLLPHFGSIPIVPLMGPDGQEYSDRHSPFDPAFVAEWDRFHRSCRERFLRDQIPVRVYLSPPSYFGEIEYYMGKDWSHPQFLCYDPLAQGLFEAWRKTRYGDVPPLDPLPRPDDSLGTDWLDLLAWRREYLAGLVKGQSRHFDGIPGVRLGIKVAVGDYAAVHGVDSGLILSQCAGDHVDVHCTNAHGLSDVLYADSLARHYASGFLIIENDGNRYTVPEIRKALTVALLAGADFFSYAYDAHLADRAGDATDAGRALEQARQILIEHRRKPGSSPIAFLHSVTTTGMYAPEYRNHSVAKCYDSLLVNGADPQVLGRLDWGQALGWPMVIGEQGILDGVLDDLSVVIVPGQPDTLLPVEVWDRLLAWNASGGQLVLMGGVQVWDEEGIRRVDPDTLTDHVTCIASLPEGRGRETSTRWTHELPDHLRGLAEGVGVSLPLRMTGEDGLLCRGLAARYMGFDEISGCHWVYAGAWDGTASFDLHIQLEGLVRLLMIDEPSLKVSGEGVKVLTDPDESSRTALWTDPSNSGASGRITCAEIEVHCPATVHFNR